ncbi:MAG: hypothetical protein ABTD50_17080 [Polyangiaceae bacterium]|jgi:hypothetical protein
MARWFTILLGLLVVALAVGVVARGFRLPKAIGRDPNARDAATDAQDSDRSKTESALAGGLGGAFEDGGEGLSPELADPGIRVDSGDAAVAALVDGMPVPPLPMSAPRTVRFGVALISYAGAQPSAGGGRPSKRSQAEARLLAEKLVQTARDDFHAAVQQGDPGSADDVGRVKLGILEPAPEYILFTLPVGNVGGPLLTPRGYWIVKRLE